MKLLFFDNNTGLDTIHDLETRARGGMISSLFILTDLLQGMGHDVTVLGDIKQAGTTQAGVYWGNWKETYHTDCEVLVCNRGTTDDGLSSIGAEHRVLWTHDLPHVGHIPQPKLINAYDCVVFMSEYARRVWTTFYPVIKKYKIIPNGVDKDRFYPREKDLDYIIFGSAPNRGLQYLSLALSALQSRVRDSLYLNAYSNANILHPNEGTLHEIDMIGKYSFKDNERLIVLDPLPQKRWAEELGRAGLMIMPTSYPEICSNAILQSLASGTPIVTTGNLGSAGEWIKTGKNGWLTTFLPNDYMVHTIEIVRGAKKILENNDLHNKMIAKAPKTKRLFTWEQIASKWDKLLRSL